MTQFPAAREMNMPTALTSVKFCDLPGWEDGDPGPVLDGLRRCAGYTSDVKPYRTGAFGLAVEDFRSIFDDAQSAGALSGLAARRFFEDRFEVFRIEAPGHVTGYYEPEIEVSPQRTGRFRYPLYRRPDDLVDLDATNRPRDMDAAFLFGRRIGDRIVEYPDRRQIDEGFLDNRGLEIAWAESRVDVFFIHVQGSARLSFPDGSVKRITYAAKTGHPYTSIGKELLALGVFRPGEATMTAIRDWFDRHPDRIEDILWRNRSCIFFREAPVDDPSAGPVAAAKTPLTAMHSLAVDRTLHTFATPFFIIAPELTHLTGAPFRRLMLAQDTGSAILGPARGDIFVGSGEKTGELAGSVNHQAVFYMFAPKVAAERYR